MATMNYEKMRVQRWDERGQREAVHGVHVWTEDVQPFDDVMLSILDQPQYDHAGAMKQWRTEIRRWLEAYTGDDEWLRSLQAQFLADPAWIPQKAVAKKIQRVAAEAAERASR